jgi:NADH pyrophosphatase NudC (nudix superfamily)
VPGEFRFCPRCASALEARDLGGRPRGVCPACGWVHWDNPTPVVAALIQYDGRVLLARNAAWPPKMFAFVTGFLERGETPREAVEREVKEETNLDTRSATLIGVYEVARFNQVHMVYDLLAEGTIRLSEELAEVRLIEPAKLRPWPTGNGLALADWMRARGLPFEFLPLPVERAAGA